MSDQNDEKSHVPEKEECLQQVALEVPLSASDYPTLELRERGSEFQPKSENVQNFKKIRTNLLARGELFEDPVFPANDSSLFFSRSPPWSVEWKRPMEIVKDPKLFLESPSRFDVLQKESGYSWLLAAMANLTLDDNLYRQVVPSDQNFQEQYAGIFHFRFWQYGRWVDIVVDDRLPTYEGELIYVSSPTPNVFWSALLEKAYAKLHGSYEALARGRAEEALVDFTGGISEIYSLSEAPFNLFNIMLQAFERNSLMASSILEDGIRSKESEAKGLVNRHTYSITRVQYVDLTTKNIPLLRLRNPSGDENEWNGPWSDKSDEWRFFSEEKKQELGLVVENDGEFWMSFSDFIKYFSRVEICNLSPDSISEKELSVGDKKKWEMSQFEGKWVCGVTAGGCSNYLETFWNNPQYMVQLVDPDEDDDDDKCTLLVALMQKNRRAQRKIGTKSLKIGFAIYHIEEPEKVPKPLPLKFFKNNSSVAGSHKFKNYREVTNRFKLQPGTYVIVPSTLHPKEEGEYLLRVFTEKANRMQQNDEEVGTGEIDRRVIDAENEVKEEEDKKNDRVREFFKKIAGKDEEVDWVKLKEILDYAMNNNVPSGENRPINGILSFFCGHFLRDAPSSSDLEVTRGGFSKDICRSMIAMMNDDGSGKLGFNEFNLLWTNIKRWKTVFELYDTSNSGYLSPFDLRQALNSAGYRLNNRVLNVLCQRYCAKDGRIDFEDFMMCSVRLKFMIEVFMDRDFKNANKAKFSLEEWIENSLYS